MQYGWDQSRACHAGAVLPKAFAVQGVEHQHASESTQSTDCSSKTSHHYKFRTGKRYVERNDVPYTETNNWTRGGDLVSRVMVEFGKA